MSLEGTVNNEYALRGKVHAVPETDITLTKQGYAADAKATGEAIEARVRVADVVDSLTSDDSAKPLSARQGAELKRQLDALAAKLGG